ncbi:MBL fold metallo-hydrolase [Bradyrhizobium sp.]|uniref:MBL fold metallo-hydrolase n=1 Tax=Bradyrhizobium sp. TaxID=376 RepID=UPI00261DA074|nr:MBL fold metallo-hydrolase [Bradyrhizobium sp.]
MPTFNRRDAMKMSAGFAAAATGFSCIELAKAGPIEVPVIDKLSVRVLVDSASDLFFKRAEVAGVKTEPGRSANSMLPLHSEWGLSLLLEPQRGDTRRTYLLDFGWTPGAINGNLDLLKVDASKIDALIMSHGHWDHLGGLMGFLDRHRKSMPSDLTIYAGGEDNFCQRYLRGAGGDLSDFGMLDRRDLAKRDVKVMLCETPVVIGDVAFTTGKIARNSIEKVLPNSLVEFKFKDGAGCNWSHYLPAEMEGKIVPDEHIHEHATCFNLKNRGLVVISSCGHVGIVNTVRQAMEVSGVQKVHAIVGGFHLGPAPADYLTQVVAEMTKLNPDVVIPMHCSGLNFTQEAQRQMPGKVLTTTTGSRITFGI